MKIKNIKLDVEKTVITTSSVIGLSSVAKKLIKKVDKNLPSLDKL